MRVSTNKSADLILMRQSLTSLAITLVQIYDTEPRGQASDTGKPQRAGFYTMVWNLPHRSSEIPRPDMNSKSPTKLCGRGCAGEIASYRYRLALAALLLDVNAEQR